MIQITMNFSSLQRIEKARSIEEIQLIQEQATQRNQIAVETPTAEDPSV